LTRITVWLVLCAVFGAATVYGLRWWTDDRFVQSTDEACVRADAVAIAPRVSDYVIEVLVTDNQAVTVGQPLVLRWQLSEVSQVPKGESPEAPKGVVPEVGICQEAGDGAHESGEKAALLPPNRPLLGQETGKIGGLMLLVN